MSLRLEIADIMSIDGRLEEWAENIIYRKPTVEDKYISDVVNSWTKEIGENGADERRELSAFIKKSLATPVYQKADALFDRLFDKVAIGEFDDFAVEKEPENTLVAYESAKGGSVYRSYIDSSVLTPTWKHKTVETTIRYSQLRENGFYTIAKLITYARDTLLNKKIQDVFKILDDALVSGDNVQEIPGNQSALTMEALDKMAVYCNDYALDGVDEPFAFGLNKYAQAMARIEGYNSYMSDKMKDDYNRYGFVKEYGGLLISGYSGAKRIDGTLVVPDKRIFGVAGKIGVLCDRGELRVLETLNNNNETVEIKVTGYEYGSCITNPEKVAKIKFAS